MLASSRYIPGTSSGSGSQPAQTAQTAHAAASDPYSRTPATTTTIRKHLPQKSYLSFKVGELSVIINKINTFNTEVPTEHVSPKPLPSHCPFVFLMLLFQLNMTDINGRLCRKKDSPKSVL